MERRVIIITGCTASGKGTLARAVAEHLGAEILSIDSMKVYRGMEIGTAKPSAAVRQALPHHLVDVVDPWEPFSAARFVDSADRAVEDIHARGRPVVAVGGTILYLKCWYEGIFEGPTADPAFRRQLRARAQTAGTASLHAELQHKDPDAAGRIHPNDLRRIERALEVYHLTGQPISALQRQWERPGPRRDDWHWIPIGLAREREDNNRRINLRVRKMLAAGLVDEARRLHDDPRGVGDQASQAVGYAELFAHFAGRLALDEAVEQIKIHSRQLAKHQRSWLKRERHLHWLDVTGVDSTDELLPDMLTIIGESSSSSPK